jgi:hypothetical protein
LLILQRYSPLQCCRLDARTLHSGHSGTATPVPRCRTSGARGRGLARRLAGKPYIEAVRLTDADFPGEDFRSRFACVRGRCHGVRGALARTLRFPPVADCHLGSAVPATLSTPGAIRAVIKLGRPREWLRPVHRPSEPIDFTRRISSSWSFPSSGERSTR